MVPDDATELDPALAPGDVAVEAPADPAAEANLGRRIGPYRVERLLARGGMGVVYLAVREDDYEQQVALKLLPRESLSVRGLERFYKERQILARLQHPHVARLLDGGTTEEALPYLVMEYVEGRRIDDYCEEHGLGVRRRLELFSTLCDAVQFAHRNLVVHRDLKPANVLVTTDGVVKLLDFGIAKLLDDEVGPAKHTAHRQGPMTPIYASPEQRLGLSVTTASDVYSLGILLSKMLTGHAEPKAPGTLAADRAARRRLAGDVDAIALKALRQEPEGRYASAAQLAADVRRHLDHLPTEAYTGSVFYRARKLVRRNKLGVALALTVLGFSVASTVLWRRAVHEKERAEVSLMRAEQVSTFLKELFKTAEPNAAQGEPPSVREVLDHSRQRLLSGELEDNPEVRAELLGTLGSVYNDLGFFTDARQLKEEALRVRRAADPSDRDELAVELNNLGRLLYDVGDFLAAEERFREAVAIWRRLGSPDVFIGLHNLAAIAMHEERYAEALVIHEEILELQRGRLDAGDPEVASSLHSLGTLHRLRGEVEKAEALSRQALAIYEEAYGPRHTRVAAVKNSLGRLLHLAGRRAEARELYEQALETRRQLLGDDHVRVAVSRRLLAELLLDEGETAAAGRLLGPALETFRRIGPDDPRTARAESVWGRCLAALGRHDEAEARLRASYRRLLELEGEEHDATRAAARWTAELYEAWGRNDEAAAWWAAGEKGDLGADRGATRAVTPR